MIGLLTGRIVRRHPNEVILDVGGVGYRVAVPLSTFCELPAASESVSLEIHTQVRDDAIALFGFATARERMLFELLLSVSGVGPKVALAILSGISVAGCIQAIERDDAAQLRVVPGVGRKLAERIVLELREKAGKIGAGGEAGVVVTMPRDDQREAESALTNLGYAPAEARKAIERVHRDAGEQVPIEKLLRDALKELAR